jgi:predicted transcriptional regulator
VKNLSQPDIIAIILEIANGGVTKTSVLTRANLTSGQLRQYVEMLVDKKLIAE